VRILAFTLEIDEKTKEWIKNKEDNMQRIMFCVVALLWAAIAFCQTYEGPFGLKMGLTYQQLKAIDPGIEKSEENYYKMTVVPKPHKSFEGYMVTISPKTGLCNIMAYGKDISTNGYGFDVSSEYKSVRDALESKYGKYNEIDFLMPSSIWDEAKDYMMALYLDERILCATWPSESGDDLSNSIKIILLQAKALNTSTGYLKLHYDFDNAASYYEEQKSRENSAF